MRIAPFIHFSEQNSDITELKAKTGNLKVRFEDGKAMSLWSGLGTFNEVASILMRKQTYCQVELVSYQGHRPHHRLLGNY